MKFFQRSIVNVLIKMLYLKGKKYLIGFFVLLAPIIDNYLFDWRRVIEKIFYFKNLQKLNSFEKYSFVKAIYLSHILKINK